MYLSSFTFTVAVLPVLLAAFYLIPEKGRRGFLLAASLLVYGWGSPIRVLYLAVCVLFDYGIGLLLERLHERKTLCTALLAGAAVIHAAAMVWIRSTVTQTALFPFGIAVYTLQGLGYLIGVYRRRHTAAVNLAELALYLSLFPTLYMGPLMEYAEFREQMKNRKSSIVQLSDGLALFIRGLAEKVVLSDTFGYIFGELRQTGQLSMLTAWLMVITFIMYLYFGMLGITEMARGLGRCFGLDMPRNFSHPFFCPSVSGFMQSWNLTLVQWFQTNFCEFLFGGQNRKWSRPVSILLMWLLMGAWYGQRVQLLLWGLTVGVLMTIDPFVTEKLFRKHYIAGLVYTSVVMSFAWVLFFSDSMAETGSIWASMLGFGQGIADRNGLYFFTSYIAMLLLGFYIAADLFRNITERLAEHGKGLRVLNPLLHGALLLFCLASMLYGEQTQELWLGL